MMRNSSHKKTLVLGIIVLFISMSNITIAENLTLEQEAYPESLLYTQSKEGKSGISLITLKIIVEKGLNNWYKEVYVDITNESNEIAEIFYQIDDGPEQKYIKPFNLNKEGKNISLRWWAVNHMGNYSDIDDPFICSIDKTDPDTDLTYEWEGTHPPWIFHFIATATDATSGMERVEFWLNEELQETIYGPGPEYIYTLPYIPPPYAFWEAIAYDMAGNSGYDCIGNPGNIEVLKSPMLHKGFNKKNSVISFSDDISSYEIVEKENNKATEQPPSDYSKTEVFDPANVIVIFNRKMGNNDWIVNNVSIPIFYESDKIDKVYYKLDEGGWKLYSEPLFISEDGIHVFSWYVVDYEGYTSTPESISFKTDRTPPEINLIKERLSTYKVKFIANVFDETSNIDRVEFNTGYPYYEWSTDYNFPYEWIWSGLVINKVTATVYDKAGNSNSNSKNTYKSCSNHFSNLFFSQFIERFPLLREVFVRRINL